MPSNLEKKIHTKLQNYNEICFGPIVSDFGWEIAYIAEFIKKYKKLFPKKKVYVCTRQNRKELYENNNLDGIITFNIEGDYETITQRTHSLFMFDKYNPTATPKPININKFLDNIKNQVLEKYPNSHFYTFTHLNCRSVPEFNLNEYDYHYEPHSDNFNTIDKIVKQEKKYPVTIFSRHRIDLTHRNWFLNNWHELFERLNNLDDFIFFIAGISPSIVKPNENLKNFFVLEDLSKDNINTTPLGLMIEALKASKFAFGVQTSGILLSNYIRIPNIYFGNEVSLVSKNYNPFNTLSQNIPVNLKKHTIEYEVSVDRVYESVMNFLSENSDAILNKHYEPKCVERIVCEIPKKNPFLEGLSPEEKIKKIRELNERGIAPPLIYKKVKTPI